MAKLDVKLTGPTWVHDQIRQAGEIVELDAKIAPQFGEVQGVEVPVEAPPVEIPEETPEEVSEEVPEEKPKKSKKTKDNSED